MTMRTRVDSTSPAGAGAAGQTTYVTVKGDTLSSIAKRFLGDGNRWSIRQAFAN